MEVTSTTAFSITLSGTDLTNVEALLNKDGTSAVSGTTYNLAATAGFMQGDSTSAADATSGITVSNYAAPAITSATRLRHQQLYGLRHQSGLENRRHQ